MNFKKIRNWGLNIQTPYPILIAGPCSAESEEQVLKSCIGAAKHGTNLLRAGIWKPRTRPNSFEGVGEQGLPWIKKAGALTNIPVTVEVANAKHVELALKHEIDVLWIGARTSVNPFSVQEIANALKGVDIPVMVKNPINPDVALWVGAIERLYQAGITRMAAIHRGFSVADSAPYRNKPMWEIPIELRRRLPNLEIIADPSHVAGQRRLLAEVGQKALDLDFDGVMVETHINPDVALSDAKQQVTPAGLGTLIEGWRQRKSNIDDETYNAKIQGFRKEIDDLDAEILDLLEKRLAVSRQIGACKSENNIAVFQAERWRAIFETRRAAIANKNLSADFANDFLQAIHNESIRQQIKVMKRTES